MLVGSVVPLALVVRSKNDSRVRRSPDCFEVRSYASLVRSFASSVVRGGRVTVVLAGAVLVTLAGLVSWVPVARGGNEVVVTTGRVYIAVVGSVNEVLEHLHLHLGFKVLVVDNRELVAVVVVVVDDVTGTIVVDVVVAIVVGGGFGHPQFLHGLQRESLGAVGTYFLQFSWRHSRHFVCPPVQSFEDHSFPGYPQS